MKFKLMFIVRITVLFIVILGWSAPAKALKFEFSAGFAYNHPTQKPIPQLTDGYGYNFNACFWVHPRIGLAVGAMGTTHKLDAGIRPPNQSVTFNSNEGLVYIEGRYKVLETRKWEISPLVGASVYNTIDGGDSSGSYLQFEDYPNYNSEDIGYSGQGYWVGLSIYREIRSYNQGYFVYLNMYYNFLSYTSHQFYAVYTDIGSGSTILGLFEAESERPANMLIFSLGVVFRFDFASF